MESDWTIKLQNLKSKITTLAACVRFDINGIKHHCSLCVWQTDPTGLDLKATVEQEIVWTKDAFNYMFIAAELFFLKDWRNTTTSNICRFLYTIVIGSSVTALLVFTRDTPEFCLCAVLGLFGFLASLKDFLRLGGSRS